MSQRYRNTARAEADEAELERLETEYRKEFGNEPEVVEVPEVVEETPEEKTWKQRYSDLKSYSDRRANEARAKETELTKRIEALEKKSTELPSNIEEARAWVEEYPDLTRIIKTLIREDTQLVEENVTARFEELELERMEIAKEKAINSIRKVHKDFDDLLNDQYFVDWVDRQPVEKGRTGQAIYDALHKGFDAQEAINAINIYKMEKKANKPEKDPSREVVQQVSRTTSTAPSPTGGKPTFSESQIDSMSAREYEKFEEQIEEARLEGRIVYDITGAAR